VFLCSACGAELLRDAEPGNLTPAPVTLPGRYRAELTTIINVLIARARQRHDRRDDPRV
jgi:hypothetical protein